MAKCEYKCPKCGNQLVKLEPTNELFLTVYWCSECDEDYTEDDFVDKENPIIIEEDNGSVIEEVDESKYLNLKKHVDKIRETCSKENCTDSEIGLVLISFLKEFEGSQGITLSDFFDESNS